MFLMFFFFRQVEHLRELSEDITHYKRLAPGRPDHSFAYLRKAADKCIELRRTAKIRQATIDAMNGKVVLLALPASGGASSSANVPDVATKAAKDMVRAEQKVKREEAAAKKLAGAGGVVPAAVASATGVPNKSRATHSSTLRRLASALISACSLMIPKPM